MEKSLFERIIQVTDITELEKLTEILSGSEFKPEDFVPCFDLVNGSNEFMIKFDEVYLSDLLISIKESAVPELDIDELVAHMVLVCDSELTEEQFWCEMLQGYQMTLAGDSPSLNTMYWNGVPDKKRLEMAIIHLMVKNILNVEQGFVTSVDIDARLIMPNPNTLPLALSYSTDNDIMYQVAKFSNDEDEIKLFVFNDGSKDDKLNSHYGYFFCVTELEIFTQNWYGNVVTISSIEQALSYICDDISKVTNLDEVEQRIKSCMFNGV
ncbi:MULTISPECIES: hypothetical protein [Vibrio]|uniref:Uncharacterized protein n=1 Tax=Vibrio vulnificus TaxID=672 RepID=A0A2S3R1W2_VIBVL|nr:MULTISPECIES: hypothetical protein [Vibrio]MCZ2798946.1 hypothetical protein [Vibrio alginolyticus]POB47091.1 hypothetical protein CRN52_13515 [Vibrio vulnificus]